MSSPEQPPKRKLNITQRDGKARRKGAGGQLFYLVIMLVVTFWLMRHLNSPAAHRLFQAFFGKPAATEDPGNISNENGDELTPVQIRIE